MITVCIPCYNHKEYIAEAILSCVKAGKLVSQILITDDNSSDGSLDIIEQLTRRIQHCKYINPCPNKNLGAHERINMLIDHAQTEWISILNSDDFFSSGCFSSCDRFVRHNQCNSYFGRINIVDSQSARIGIKIPGTCLEYDTFKPGIIQSAVREKDWLGLILNQNFIATTSNFCFRRQVWEELGGFEDYRYAHDWSFFIRAIARFGTAYNPFHTINYRVHESNTIKESARLIHREASHLLDNTISSLGGIIKLANMSDSPERLLELALDNRYFYTHIAYTPYLAEGRYPMATKKFPIKAGTGTPSSLGISIHIDSASCLEVNAILLNLENPLLDAVAVRAGDGSFLKLIGIRHEVLQRKHTLHERVLVINTSNEFPCHLASSNLCSKEKGLPLRYSNQCIDTSGMEDSPNVIANPFQRLIAPKAYNRKKRILILTGFFAVGGVERYVLDVVRNLNRFYDFAMICMETQGRELGSLVDNAALHGVDVYFLDQVLSSDLRSLIERLEASYSFSACWIINGSTRLWPVYGLLGDLMKYATIIDNQAYDHSVGWIEGLQEYASTVNYTFVAHNSKILGRFVEDFLIDPDLIAPIYPCFSSIEFSKSDTESLMLDSPLQRKKDSERFAFAESLGISADDRIYLNIARLDKQKNHSYLLDVANEMKHLDPRAIFLIIGDGPCRDELEQKISRYSLNNVKILGFKSNLGSFYRISSMLVITSVFEGLPIVMLEAMASGLPVCASQVGDIEYVLNKYKFGFLHDNRDPCELANRLLLAKSQEYRLDVDTFYEEFSSEAISRKYRAVFEGTYLGN